MTPQRSRITKRALLGTLIVLIGACTETVYQDRPPYNPPPDANSGFLGYYTASERQTTCGNCHVGQQQDWVQTLHAAAWDTLQANAGAQDACETCHTVDSRGNGPSAAVGHDAVKNEGYHDVQCESCHGPGYTHVQNPSVAANRPIASAMVYPNVSTDGTVLTAADTAALVNSSCGACHQYAGPSRNHNYLAEWRSSRHGQLREAQAAEADCQRCHEGKGFLAFWGVNTLYKEQGTDILLPQNCVVCHDPHGTAKGADGKPLPGQLRFPIDNPNNNLCTKCHGREDRAFPTASNARGPHGVQGPVLFGSAGYFPPGTIYDSTAILTTHGSSANPRLCAGCHVNAQVGVDAEGNALSFTGHTFHPLPCLSQKSPPLVDTTYTNDCPYDVPSRSFASCTALGCHGTEEVALSRLTGILNEKEAYLNVIWVDLNGNQKVDAYPADTGYLAKVMLNAPHDLDFTNAPYNTVLTPAKGALFNAQMTGEELASHPDGSKGVHNPFLYRALLQSSIADLEANYGSFLPAPPAHIQAKIQAAIRSGQLRMAPAIERVVMTPIGTLPSGGRVGSR